jgi:hypothetical protein
MRRSSELAAALASDDEDDLQSVLSAVTSAVPAASPAGETEGTVRGRARMVLAAVAASRAATTEIRRRERLEHSLTQLVASAVRDGDDLRLDASTLLVLSLRTRCRYLELHLDAPGPLHRARAHAARRVSACAALLR